MKIYAKCPENLDTNLTPYLTPGNLYEVVSKQDDDFFEIIDNDNDKSDPRHCRWKECAHLDGLNWTRIEVKTRADVLADEAENMVGALRKILDLLDAVSPIKPENYADGDWNDIIDASAILARIDEVKE
jgi:hypothetical protein